MSVTQLVFKFQLIICFRILRSWKARFWHQSICPTRYVLKGLRWLEVSNRVRNWNTVKNIVYVGSKLQLCHLEIPIFIYKLMCQSSIINSVSFVFCDLNRVATEIKVKLSFKYDHQFKFRNRNTSFIFKVNVCQCKNVFS